jgi:HK97 family phage prohead protease
METKMKHFYGKWKVKKIENDDLIIEGLANANIVDSVGDQMVYEGGDFKRFELNPIMLFNHDHNVPVGKCIEWKISEAGLWIKARISKSSVEKIQYVRDMILEGILNSFSIGFNIVDAAMKGDIFYIKEWELHEVSVVSLPCNMESLFSISKSFEGKSRREIKQMILTQKGANVAALLNDKLDALAEGQEGFDKEAVIAGVADTAEVTVADVQNVLSGETVQVPESILLAFSAALGIEIESLVQANQEDSKPADSAPEATPSDMPPATEDGCKPKGDCPPDEDTTKLTGEAFQKCVSEKIPKLLDEGKTQDEAVAIAMSMCEQEGKCAVTLITKTEIPMDTQTTNPMIDLMSAQLAMLGQISTQLRTLSDILIKMQEPEEPEAPETEMPEPVEPPAPAAAPVVEPVPPAPKAVANDAGIVQNEQVKDQQSTDTAESDKADLEKAIRTAEAIRSIVKELGI